MLLAVVHPLYLSRPPSAFEAYGSRNCRRMNFPTRLLCRYVGQMSSPPNGRKFFDLISSPLEKTWRKTSNIIFLGDFRCELKLISTTKCDPTSVKLLHIKTLSRNQLEEHHRRVHSLTSLLLQERTWLVWSEHIRWEFQETTI